MPLKLSICIPTYNRAPYLDSVLSHLFDERPVGCEFEVIVANNASEDNTEEVLRSWSAREPSLRTWRQTRNVGPANNLHCAFRLARGEYLVYLADDDRLVPGRVDQIVGALDQMPDLAVVQAPWEVQNELTGQSYGTHYKVPENKLFKKDTALDLLNYIFTGHIFPEIAVYRASAVHKIAPMPFRAFYAFVFLAECLDSGDVLFVTDPFYICRVPDGTGPQVRKTNGADGIVNDRDSYQAGLEYLVLRCFSHVGDGEMQQVAVVRQMIERFMDIRLVHAKDALVRDHNWRGTYEFVVRMRARGLIARAEARRLDQELGLSSRAAIQAFLEAFDTMTGLEDIAVVGYADPSDPIGRIKQQRPDAPVRVLGEEPAQARRDRTLVLAGPHADSAALVAAGYLPGVIVAESDLLRQFAA